LSTKVIIFILLYKGRAFIIKAEILEKKQKTNTIYMFRKNICFHQSFLLFLYIIIWK